MYVVAEVLVRCLGIFELDVSQGHAGRDRLCTKQTDCDGCFAMCFCRMTSMLKQQLRSVVLLTLDLDVAVKPWLRHLRLRIQHVCGSQSWDFDLSCTCTAPFSFLIVILTKATCLPRRALAWTLKPGPGTLDAVSAAWSSSCFEGLAGTKPNHLSFYALWPPWSLQLRGHQARQSSRGRPLTSRHAVASAVTTLRRTARTTLGRKRGGPALAVGILQLRLGAGSAASGADAQGKTFEPRSLLWTPAAPGVAAA